MTKTRKPVVLTVDDKTARVVPDAERYQNLLELEDPSPVAEVLRQRLMSRSLKKGRTAEDFFNEFFAKNDTSVED